MQKIEQLQLDERREAEVRLTVGRSTGDAQAGELLKRLVLDGGGLSGGRQRPEPSSRPR